MSEPDDRAAPPGVTEERPASAGLARAIAQMVDDVANRPFSRDLRERLEALVEMLVARGQLLPYHRALLGKLKGGDVSTVRLSVFQDKRAVASTERDCAALMPLCKGRCCSFDVSLSAQDLADRRLEWDLHQPYLLRKDPEHGYCSHHGADGGCGIYEERPGTCRAYDCAKDPRVWLDFEKKLPAPMPWWVVAAEDRGKPPEERVRKAPGWDDDGGDDGDDG